MSLPPKSDSPLPTPSPVPNRQRSFPWFWLGIFTGTVLSAAGLGLAAWAWIFIHDDLSPLISSTLSDSLDRPVDLGDVEKVTLSSIQIGPSQMGASDADPTTLSVESAIVEFDLIKTLLTSRLGLDLTVVGADGYLEQDEEKGWLNFEGPEPQEERDQRFEVRLDDIRLRDSQITLVPLPAENQAPRPILLEQLGGRVDFDDITVAGEEARRTRFEVQGNPAAGGELTV
ncbi:MAG: hypothetical protein WBC73_00300, partial [Phormidesmis sp.]